MRPTHWNQRVLIELCWNSKMGQREKLKSTKLEMNDCNCGYYVQNSSSVGSGVQSACCKMGLPQNKCIPSCEIISSRQFLLPKVLMTHIQDYFSVKLNCRSSFDMTRLNQILFKRRNMQLCFFLMAAQISGIHFKLVKAKSQEQFIHTEKVAVSICMCWRRKRSITYALMSKANIYWMSVPGMDISRVSFFFFFFFFLLLLPKLCYFYCGLKKVIKKKCENSVRVQVDAVPAGEAWKQPDTWCLPQITISLSHNSNSSGTSIQAFSIPPVCTDFFWGHFWVLKCSSKCYHRSWTYILMNFSKVANAEEIHRNFIWVVQSWSYLMSP